jgi:drug/metabolite transporter (DMT)-like permease
LDVWVIYSIIASVLWGLDYALTQEVLGKIRMSTLLSIELFFAFIITFGISLSLGSYAKDIPEILASKRTILLVVLIIIAFNIANTLIVLSIGSKNATLAGLIEISYPLFIALFSWLFFGEANLNTGSAVGGILILLGVLLVYCFN